MSLIVPQVSYAIGVAQPLSVHVDTYGTGKKPDKEILAAVTKKFDFRPGGASLPIAQLFFTNFCLELLPHASSICWLHGERFDKHCTARTVGRGSLLLEQSSRCIA